MSEETTLADLLALNLHKFEDEVCNMYPVRNITVTQLYRIENIVPSPHPTPPPHL